MRLIDADALKLDIAIACVHDSNPRFLNWLNNAPTVDAVPVVRCRECRHHHGRWCQILGVDHLIVTNEDDYCSRAERKEE